MRERDALAMSGCGCGAGGGPTVLVPREEQGEFRRADHAVDFDLPAPLHRLISGPRMGTIPPPVLSDPIKFGSGARQAPCAYT